MFNKTKLILSIVFLVTLCAAAYILLVVIPTQLAEKSYEGAKQIGHDIRKAFNFTPTITVNNTVVLQEDIPVLELATLSQRFRHQYQWTNTWMGSTKKIDIQGSFEAKAGFDLLERFTIDINDDKAVVTLPDPKLLSLTPMHDVTFRDEQGVWNWVNMEDRAAAMNAFTRNARTFAEQSKMVDKARLSMEKKLTDILQAHGKEVQIQYTPGNRISPR